MEAASRVHVKAQQFIQDSQAIPSWPKYSNHLRGLTHPRPAPNRKFSRYISLKPQGTQKSTIRRRSCSPPPPSNPARGIPYPKQRYTDRADCSGQFDMYRGTAGEYQAFRSTSLLGAEPRPDLRTTGPYTPHRTQALGCLAVGVQVMVKGLAPCCPDQKKSIHNRSRPRQASPHRDGTHCVVRASITNSIARIVFLNRLCGPGLDDLTRSSRVSAGSIQSTTHPESCR